VSTAHVATVVPFWQTAPAALQIDEAHVHAEALPVPVHA
jgi:hypothetical protein